MQTIYLDISNKGVYPCIYAKQGDVGRKFLLIVTDGGVPFDCEEMAISVWYDGDSRSGNYTHIGEKKAIIVNGNKITVSLIQQMLANAGNGVLSVSVSDASGSQIGLWNIDYCVEEKPGLESEEATQYYDAFSKTAADLALAAKNFTPDKTLSKSGSPADAAETGRQISVERARIDQFTSLGEGSTTGDAELADIRVAYNGLIYPNAGTAVRTQCKKLSGRIEEIVAIEGDLEVVNLFDKDSPGILKNHFFGSDSQYMTTHTEYAISGYHISDYIPVEEGKQYTTNRDGSGFNITETAGPWMYSFWYYDENKQPISRPVGTTYPGEQYYTSTAPVGAKYARIDFYFTGATIMFVEGDVFPEEYIAYDPVAANPQKVLILPHSKEYMQRFVNPLYGKTIVFAGDSICEGYNFGDTEDAYAGRIANRNNMTYENFGVSGTTLTEKLAYYSDGTEKPSISSRLDTMYRQYPNADYIIIEGGTNDADLIGSRIDGETVERFGEYSTNDFSGNYDRETFCGALESILYRATQYWRGKKIGYIVAHKMGVNNNGYTADKNNRRNYFETAIAICNKWGIPVLNLWDDCSLNPSLPYMYTSGSTWEENASAGNFYADGQHLLSAGYDYIADIINAWLKSMSVSEKCEDDSVKERPSVLEQGFRHIVTRTIETDEGLEIGITKDKDGKPFSCSEFHIHMTVPPSEGSQLYICSVMYSYMFFTSVARSATATRTLSIDVRHIGGGWWNGSMLYGDNVTSHASALSGYNHYSNFRSNVVIGEKVNSLVFYGGTSPFPNGTVIEIYGK